MNPLQKQLAELLESNNRLLRDLDKVNMINGAILFAITEKGSLTRAEYNLIYARTLAEWQARHAAPHN